MVSASIVAMCNCRMRGEAAASGDSGMVSVTTSSSSTELFTFCTAGPDSTGCVT